MMEIKELKPGYHLFGNKGNVWNNTAHIYKNGTGNMCGTPALSTNWVREMNITHAGCPECIAKYNQEAKA